MAEPFVEEYMEVFQMSETRPEIDQHLVQAKRAARVLRIRQTVHQVRMPRRQPVAESEWRLHTIISRRNPVISSYCRQTSASSSGDGGDAILTRTMP